MNDAAPASRLKIANFDLISFTGHEKHGRATYVRSLCAGTEAVEQDNVGDTIRIGSYTVTNIYKPATIPWENSPLKSHHHPAIYVGDFKYGHNKWPTFSSMAKIALNSFCGKFGQKNA